MPVRSLVLMLLLALIAPAAAAAQTTDLAGRVTDPQGRVVSGATIRLAPMPPAGAITRTARSADDGSFMFAAVRTGTYQIQVELAGFEAWSETVTVGSEPPGLEVVLQIASITEDVVVSGRAPNTLARPTPAASRLELTPLETPASVAIVPGELVRNLGTPTLIQAKALAPGITAAAPMGNGGNLLTSRGFTGANSVKQLFNGLEIYNAGNVVSFPFDPWNVEHIGVLYGPASVLYGSGAIGGAVNVVARRPDPYRRRHEVALSAGSFGTYHTAIDATGPLSDRVSYRFDASARRSSHWVERGDSDSLAVSGSVRFDVSDRLRFTVSNDFGNQNPSVYLGTPVLNNAPVPGLRYKNYNVADAELNFTDNWTSVETAWTPRPNVTVRNNTYYLYHDRIYHDVFRFAYVPATNSVNRTMFRDIQDTWETQYGDTGYVKVAGRLFGRENEVLAGIDVNRNYYSRNDNVRGGSSVVNAITFNPGVYRDFYANVSIPFYRMDVGQVAVFTENRLRATDRLSIVLGVRQDHYDVNRFDNRLNRTTVSDHDGTGWNAGAVVDVAAGIAVYGQVAAATDPVNSLSSINADQQGFNLSPGRQAEGGVKQSALGGRVEWTFAAYRLVKEDLLTPSLVDPSRTEQVGRQSSRGVEGSVALRLGDVRVDVNGAVLEARFDEFWANVGGRAVSLAGNVPLNVPERNANLLVFWDATSALQLRSLVRYVGRRFADNTNALVSLIPSYTVVDLGARWQVRPNVSLDLRLDNALDEVYADSGDSFAWLLGQPRAVTVGTSITF
jgi:iron complex outermembrane receptor protein